MRQDDVAPAPAEGDDGADDGGVRCFVAPIRSIAASDVQYPHWWRSMLAAVLA